MTWREPKIDAAWRERRELREAAATLAARDPHVLEALEAARSAFDKYCDASVPERNERLVSFVAAVRCVAIAAHTAQPSLDEIAVPAPGDTVPFLDLWIAIGIALDRITRDADPLAVAMRDELRGLVSPRVRALRPLNEIRADVGLTRARARRESAAGAPAGGEMLELPELLRRVRAVTSKMPRYEKVTLRTIAKAMGYGERTLRTWFAHHGVNIRALLRMEREAVAGANSRPL